MPGGIAEWQSRAAQLIHCDPNGHTANVSQNMLITKAYARMYLAKPNVFKWAGMAAYASYSVGLGIAVGKATDIMVDAQIKTAMVQTVSWDMLFRPGPLLTEFQQRTNVTDLDNMLIAGNKAVFHDIYWQHLAYTEKGLDALLPLLETFPARRREILIQGWKEVDAGAKDSNAASIWHGNELLLRYEQEFTLQPVYDRYPGTADMLSYALVSPLPDQWAPFQVDFLGGSVRTFANRWAWISKELLPQWKKLDLHDFPSLMQLLLLGAAPKPLICLSD